MAAEVKKEIELEIAHVLFIDIVGYSKLLINEQSDLLQHLKEMVRGSEQVRAADAAGKLIRLATGDGMALVFRNSPEAPAHCALELCRANKQHPKSQLRMGIHSGPINEVSDVNERANVTGAGINMAQRIMDCGDTGHILLSQHVADDLEQYPRWRPLLHELGECEVKHGVRLRVVNLYTDEVGNPAVPDKFRTAKPAPETVSIPSAKSSGARWRPIIVGATLLTLSAAAFLWWHRTSGGSARGAKPVPVEAKSAPVISTVPEKSIAVLPFESLSKDEENAYFADGMQEEILARLSKISDLKVISRTSTQKYKSKPDNLRDIAQQLGVANVVEGSVQRAGDLVRVTAQLINATTDSHLWAETYDRKLTDIFAVESDIAKRIADILQAKLTGSERQAIAAQPTRNTEAHQLYLKGRYFWNKSTGNDLRKAIDYFNQAISADGNYALAYAGLTDAYLLLPFFTAGTPQECYPKAKEAAGAALQLDDTLADAHFAFAQVLQFYDFNYDRAEVEFRRGLQLDSNNVNGHWRYSWLLAARGRSGEALAEIKRAVGLDPLSLIINTDLGYFYIVMGRYDEAIAQLRSTIEIDPNFYYAHGNLGEALDLKGQFSDALSEYKKVQELNDDPFVLVLYAHAYAASGDEAQARKFLHEMQEVAKHRYVQDYAFACVHAALGEKEAAIQWLERAYHNRAGADLAFIRIDPFLAPLRGDPRFEKLAVAVLAGGEPPRR